MPERIQLSRRKGWRLPAKTVKVDRSSRWGNPFIVAPDVAPGTVIDERRGRIATPTPAASVEAYRTWLATTLEGAAVVSAAKGQLAGLHLACSCPLGAPCHADVLLQVVNEAQPTAALVAGEQMERKDG